MERCGRALSMLWAIRINGIIWCHVQQACLHKAVDTSESLHYVPPSTTTIIDPRDTKRQRK